MELPNDNESEVQQEELKESKTSNMKKPASLDGKKKGRGEFIFIKVGFLRIIEIARQDRRIIL